MAYPKFLAWLWILVISLFSEHSKFGVADSPPPDVGNSSTASLTDSQPITNDNFHNGRGYTGNGYVSSAGDSGGGRYELCGTDISTFLPPPYGNISGLSCTPLWNTFVLRVSFIRLTLSIFFNVVSQLINHLVICSTCKGKIN